VGDTLGFEFEVALGFELEVALGFELEVALGFELEVALGFELEVALGFELEVALGFARVVTANTSIRIKDKIKNFIRGLFMNSPPFTFYTLSILPQV
jgi:hypothetical protein